MHIQLPVTVNGHVLIKDDLDNVLLDEDNAVHPENMSRVIARALANESNFWIHRIAFGNGGTEVNGAQQITYRTPNDGQPPDTYTWDSRLYSETYSEVIDESNVALLSTDPGSSGPNVGQRPGGGANPSGDLLANPGVRSTHTGLLTSEVVITSVLNAGEPTGQFNTDQDPNIYPLTTPDTARDFLFDEIGLYTTGAPARSSNGYHNVDVGNKISTDDTGLLANTPYSFTAVVNGTSYAISFTTPASGGSGPLSEILFGDLCEAINTNDVTWGFSGLPTSGTMSVSITDYSASFPTITGAQTFGHLHFESSLTGSSSSVVVSNGVSNDLFAALTGTLLTPVQGQNIGVEDDPITPTNERERLLTHIIFSPILKSANRTLTITYTLTVNVARTQ